MIRVFPRKTKATPIDQDVRFGPPGLFDEEPDEVNISVTFKWDRSLAESLYRAWNTICSKVSIGGPAYDDAGANFEPGKYLKKGYVITSRGCPNRCWFCDAWKREGNIRELPICQGNNILDNNLLACSDDHIKGVFEMLKSQKNIEFTGGLEAKRLKDWHIHELSLLNPKQIYFAYDTPDDLEPLIIAGKKLHEAGFSEKSHALRCFILCGYQGDSISKTQARINKVMQLGFTPMVMYYRPDNKTILDKEWAKFIRIYSMPRLIYMKEKSVRDAMREGNKDLLEGLRP